MARFKKIYTEEIIDEVPDRYSNLLYVRQDPSGHALIQLRNIKINLLTEEERRMWKHGFMEALEKFKQGDFLKNDI